MADVVVLDYRQGGTGIGIGRYCSADNTIQTDKELQIYAGRGGSTSIGADLNFCAVSSESQKIGWCGGTQSSDTLLQLYRHTTSSSGSAGSLMRIDKWNVCYYNFNMNYFANSFRFYDASGSTTECSIKFNNSTSYLYFHNPSNNTNNLGAYNSSAGNIWYYNASSSQLILKAGYGTTSDARLKYNFDEFTNWEDYHSFYMSLKPLTFKYNNDMREETHIGMKAQEVAESITKNNLDNEKLCLVNHHESEEMEDGIEYTLAYQELIPLNIKMIQEQEKEIQELRRIIDEQQELINTLINNS